MNATINSPPSDAVNRCLMTLRWLIVTSILLGIFAIALSFLQIPFLPETLQQFERESFASPLGFRGVLFLCVAVPSLIFTVVVYIALWRGWRIGRRLYGISMVISIPLCLLIGPSVHSALLYTTEGAGFFVSGVILGLLYFSDLRNVYELPQSP